MTCNEVQRLSGPYLDSELDAKTTVEIQQHLLACADCARAFATDTKLDAQVMTGLKRGPRTAALWEQIEDQVINAAQPATRASRPTPGSRPAVWWRELLWPSPQAWAGLAAVWVVILAADFATPEAKPTFEASHVTPPSPQMRQILKEQKKMLAELGGVTEKLEARQTRGVAPQPRSERRKPLMNT